MQSEIKIQSYSNENEQFQIKSNLKSPIRGLEITSVDKHQNTPNLINSEIQNNKQEEIDFKKDIPPIDDLKSSDLHVLRLMKEEELAKPVINHKNNFL